MNLQDARHVVSYDLPWNPVRLIQRIGRIDRLGSTHDVVFAHMFIPQRSLDRLIGLLERIRSKLAAIHTGVGAETCFPHEFAGPAFLDRLARGDPHVLDEIERNEAAPFEAEERLRSAHRRVSPHIVRRRPSATPFVAVHKSTLQSILIAVRVDEAVHVALCPASRQLLLDAPSAFEALTQLIEGARDSRTSRTAYPSPSQPDREAVAHALHALRRWLETSSDFHGQRRDPARHRRATPGRALSRELLAALARVPGGPHAQLCARAEKVLAILARGGPAGLEHAFASLRATAVSPHSAASLCETLETLLSGYDRHGEEVGVGGSQSSSRIEFIGAIQLTEGPS